MLAKIPEHGDADTLKNVRLAALRLHFYPEDAATGQNAKPVGVSHCTLVGVFEGKPSPTLHLPAEVALDEFLGILFRVHHRLHRQFHVTAERWPRDSPYGP